MTILTFLLKHCVTQMRKHHFLQIACTHLNCPRSNECKFIDFHRNTPVYVRALSSCTNLKLSQAVQDQPIFCVQGGSIQLQSCNEPQTAAEHK